MYIYMSEYVNYISFVGSDPQLKLNSMATHISINSNYFTVRPNPVKP
jgi:hypothetical protein